jgi:uncharacterized protein (DUF1499 family)
MSKFVAISLSLYFVTLAYFGFMPAASAHSFTNTLNSALASPMALFSFSGIRPTDLGVTGGKLLDCPNTPNCVSSQSSDDEHKIAPLTFSGDTLKAFEELKSVISSLPRTKIITAKDNYIYAEFTSAFMGYVDDVEFYLNTEKKVIEVRSASRLGKSDLGVNRDRIESIRAKLA